MSSQRQSLFPFSSANSTASGRSKAEDPSSYKCSCGTGDGTGNYIECDNENCKLSWYHWECVQVTEAPVRTWLCPSCSPSAAFYIKQLVKKRAASPIVPKIEMTEEAAGSKPRKQRQKSVLEIKGNDVAKKGVAVKKHGEEKPKPKWKGWVELSSDGEQEFKEKVDAQWDVEDDLAGKRRRDSKAVAEETELGPRVLRARSRSEQHLNKRAEHEQEVVEEEEVEEADSGESLYQEDPQGAPLVPISSNDSEDSEEPPVVRRRGRVIYISSSDSNSDDMDVDQPPTTIETHSSDSLSDPPSSSDSDDSDDTMDIDQSPTPTETDSPGSLSDPPSSSSREVKPSHPGQATSAYKDNNNNKETLRQPETEDPEDTTDMELEYEDALEYQDEEEPKASSRIDPPVVPEYSSMDDAHSPSPTNASHDREMADSQNRSPSVTSPGANNGVSPGILESSSPALGHEDAMDIRADDDVQEFQASVTATAIVDHASLYQNQRNSWGGFPESAIRSTLPRLA